MRLVVHTDLLHTSCFPYEQYAWIELLQLAAAKNSNAEVLLLQKNTIINCLDKQVIHIPVSKPAQQPLLWRLFYAVRLRLLLDKLKPDIFLSLSATQVQISSVAQWLYIPDGSCSGGTIQHYLQQAPRRARRNNVLLLHADPTPANAAPLHAMPPYVPAIFTAVPAAIKETVKAAYTGGAEYFLYMGPLHTQANLLNLLRAFSQFKKWQTSNMKLVLCGTNLWPRKHFERLLGTYKHRHDVVITGAIPINEAAQLTASAYALVHPFAGDGPAVSALAAMQAAVPAIVIRTGANEAAGGNAFLYAQQNSSEELAAKMMLLYKDETLRSQLIRNGKMQLAAAVPHPAVLQLTALLQASVSK